MQNIIRYTRMMYGEMWRLEAIFIFKQRLVICVCRLQNETNESWTMCSSIIIMEAVCNRGRLFFFHVLFVVWPWKSAGLEQGETSQGSILDFAGALVQESISRSRQVLTCWLDGRFYIRKIRIRLDWIVGSACFNWASEQLKALEHH